MSRPVRVRTVTPSSTQTRARHASSFGSNAHSAASFGSWVLASIGAKVGSVTDAVRHDIAVLALWRWVEGTLESAAQPRLGAPTLAQPLRPHDGRLTHLVTVAAPRSAQASLQAKAGARPAWSRVSAD